MYATNMEPRAVLFVDPQYLYKPIQYIQAEALSRIEIAQATI